MPILVIRVVLPLPAGTFAFRLKDFAFHLALSMGSILAERLGELLVGKPAAGGDNADTVLAGPRH